MTPLPSSILLDSYPKLGLRLRKPVTVVVAQYPEDEDIYLEHDDWSIYGSGRSLDDAIEDWWEDFSEVWNHLHQWEDTKLGPMLRKVKHSMEELVEYPD